MTGSSEASAIEAVGKAEAEGMRQKAAAYKMYGDAALTSLVLEALPKVRQLYFLSTNCKQQDPVVTVVSNILNDHMSVC